LDRGKAEHILHGPDGGLLSVNNRTQPFVQKYNPESDRFESTSVRLFHQNRFTKCLVIERNGTVWAGYADGLQRFQDGTWTSLTTRDGLASDEILRLFVDRHDGLWATTAGEILHQFRAGRFHRVKFTHDDQDPHVVSMADDREGNLWLGTENGLFCLQPRRLKTISTRDGLPEANVRLLHVDRNDVVWTATGLILTSISNQQVRSYQPTNINPNNQIGSFYMDRDDTLWIGINKEGIYRLDPDRMKRFLPIDELAFSCFAQDKQGLLWVGTSAGLGRFDSRRKTFELMSGAGHPALAQTRMLHFDRDDQLWVGTYGQGLTRCRDGQILATYTMKDGLPDNRVFSAHETSDGALWIGTENGLCRHKNGSFFAYGPGHGLPEAVINRITEDDAGFLWISGMHGIHRASRQELDAIAEGRAPDVHWVSFGEADGMDSSETNGEHQPSGPQGDC
jgi:ligand-binding sensor domain-containing protein